VSGKSQVGSDPAADSLTGRGRDIDTATQGDCHVVTEQRLEGYVCDRETPGIPDHPRLNRISLRLFQWFSCFWHPEL
jgi:hypothetical protein